MDYIKSPYNWVGNKYKHLDIINSFNFQEYENVIDVMMGSGNILFNIVANGNKYVGNDKQGFYQTYTILLTRMILNLLY